MNEVGSKPSVEAYNSPIRSFSCCGLYKECEAILMRMGETGVPRNVDSFNGLIEAFRLPGRFEEAVKAYVEMRKMRLDPDERTLEALLIVYCFAGLVEECEEHFEEIKSSGVLPRVMCYCMTLAEYAKCDRLDDAFKLLDEMLKNKASNIHQVIKGDYDDGSNWQMVEYVFDKLNSEGCGLGIRFYNTLLEALWFMGQKERASRVLNEAIKHGLFPELFRKNKLVWSIDTHRMCEAMRLRQSRFGLNDMLDLLHVAMVVSVRGKTIAKAAYLFLQEKTSSSFSFPAWNNGRIICNRAQLKQILSDLKSSQAESERNNIVALHSFPLPVMRISTGDTPNNSKVNIGTKAELVTSTV